MDNNKNPIRNSELSNMPKAKINKPVNFGQGSSLMTSGVILGSEHVNDPAAKPKRTKKILLSTSIAVLAILLATAIALILILPGAKRPADLRLDFSAITDIYVNHETATTDHNIMPGDEIECLLSLETIPNEDTQNVNNDVFLRIKTSVICENNYYSGILNLNFIDQSDWYKGADGYYYYQKTETSDGLLSVGEKVTVMKKMSIDGETGNEFAGKAIIIKFYAEVLQAQYQAIEEIWPTAPWEWASQYKDLTW